MRLMSDFFPTSPFIPASRNRTIPACEWIMPAPSVQRRDYFSTCKMLPSGTPDYLQVSIGHSEDGMERCTAAIYGNRAYVIHYEFKPRDP
jgi:hypothetical protein